MQDQNTINTLPPPEKPGVFYSTGVNLFYWFLEVLIKAGALLFFWNNGIFRLGHSIPKLTYLICFSILFVISMIARLIGNAIADTVVVRGFVIYQQLQKNKILLDTTSNKNNDIK